ncbi:MAG: hypothetical protein ACJ8FM_16960 [Xanthobacteraceae bacterium]
MMDGERLRVGYIPLVDAAALIVAADAGFAHTASTSSCFACERICLPTFCAAQSFRN